MSPVLSDDVSRKVHALLGRTDCPETRGKNETFRLNLGAV